MGVRGGCVPPDQRAWGAEEESHGGSIMAERTEQRRERLCGAFEADGFRVVGESTVGQGEARLGLAAEHRDATNASGEPKRAYYVEGTPWEMGFLMGRLAEPVIQRMSEDYMENYIREMIPWARRRKTRAEDWPIYEWLVRRVNDLVPADISSTEALAPRIDEIRGMVAGCREAFPETEITETRLWALNAGVDFLFGLIYEFKLLRLLFGSRADALRLPTACNALAVLNEAAEDGPLFGRDFMFPACGVFQEAACLTIYNPLPSSKDGPLPLVSVTAPGIVGSISAMNARGVAGGVNVVHGGHNEPSHLGINSLLFVRHVIEHGTTLDVAVDRALDAPRGISWLYPLAADGNGQRDRACVIEASATPRDERGRPVRDLDVTSFPRRRLRREGRVPSAAFLAAHPSPGPFRNGAMVRWDDAPEPEPYTSTFNEKLWGRTWWSRWLLWPRVHDEFGPGGRINRQPWHRFCPSSAYFAPLRTEPGRLLLATNHYITPEMRLTSMDDRILILDGISHYANDSQWRYDLLNARVRRARGLAERDAGEEGPPRSIGRETAREIINTFEPACTETGRCPYLVQRACYHFRKFRSPECRRRRGPIPIEGAMALFDLRRRSIEAYFGYYGDDWIGLHLLPFVDAECERTSMGDT